MLAVVEFRDHFSSRNLRENQNAISKNFFSRYLETTDRGQAKIASDSEHSEAVNQKPETRSLSLSKISSDHLQVAVIVDTCTRSDLFSTRMRVSSLATAVAVGFGRASFSNAQLADPMIVGGVPAEVGRYPYYVSVQRAVHCRNRGPF